VYVSSSGDGKLYALDAATGTVLWSGTNGRPFPVFSSLGPAVANGVIHIGSSDGNLDAFSLLPASAAAAGAGR